MEKSKNLEGSLCDRVITIAGTSSSGFFDISIKVKDEIINLFYEQEKIRENFFSINIQKKEISFHQSPKSYLTEKGCIELAKYLREEGYEIKGINSFINNPQFKTNELSLY